MKERLKEALATMLVLGYSLLLMIGLLILVLFAAWMLSQGAWLFTTWMAGIL